ncbi:MAG TPA: nitroreductase family protein [Egibacteraceae bacterium]|nr:nitroreductase family protein [Egibacteraceae bacterium]
MEFAEVVRRRRMVRSYRPDPVDPEALERILDAARRGPSAGFAQGQYVVVVTDADTRRRIAELCGERSFLDRGFQPWLSRAPVHLVPCVREADYHERYAARDKAAPGRPRAWRVPYWWVDAGAALMLVLLAAVDEGLAAGFLDVRDVAAMRALLGIPDDVAPLGLVTIGHPAPDRRSESLRRRRRPPGDIIRRGRWG